MKILENWGVRERGRPRAESKITRFLVGGEAPNEVIRRSIVG
jgi:hypothetical protein